MKFVTKTAVVDFDKINSVESGMQIAFIVSAFLNGFMIFKHRKTYRDNILATCKFVSYGKNIWCDIMTVSKLFRTQLPGSSIFKNSYFYFYYFKETEIL